MSFSKLDSRGGDEEKGLDPQLPAVPASLTLTKSGSQSKE
jgi:hypothetical protein